MIKNGKKPATVEECMATFLEILTPAEQVLVTNMKEDDLITTHHGLGQWIRNNWDLWQGGPLLEHMKSLGFIHPDDMSSSLIREFWCRANGKPSQMVEDVLYYKDFWEKNK